MSKINFLKNYLEDLEHLASQGLDSLNHSTNGTPEFKNKEEFVKYISDLKKCIDIEEADNIELSERLFKLTRTL